MNISAKTVVAKMEQELAQLKREVDSGVTENGRFREHVTALRTYCDLLSSDSNRETNVQHTSSMAALERQKMMGDLEDKPSVKKDRQPATKSSLDIYDADDKPDSDNLLDF
ncbi:YwdI family protein [Alteribacter populi]|uniref:YwdI family protein n=1 Tax=Alteribacter populi TaxID=2011011 RepID=UPI000BBB55FA|nr:YwdI family protein [Alteribacter populi]